jgi:hypothetical protein
MNIDILNIFFKMFTISFSVLYFFYALIITRQSQVLNKTVEFKEGGFIVFISSIQMIFGLILIYLSIFFF